MIKTSKKTYFSTKYAQKNT